MITTEQLQKILPRCKDPEEWVNLFEPMFEKHSLITIEQKAMFIAQVGHESAQLNVTAENLNYSAKALGSLFSKYFPGDLKRNPQLQFIADANDYARNQEKIANRIYANRMGNGNEASGDGWKYRGGGLIQLTGRNNYQAFSKSFYDDENVLDNNPELVRTDKTLSLESAFWFWDTNSLSKYDDIKVVTKKINGGDNGLDERIHFYHIALEILT